MYTDQKYKTKFHDIEVGDKVLVKNMKKENKLQSWSYILRIFDILINVSFTASEKKRDY